MKHLLWLLLVTHAVEAQTTFRPEAGLYKCVKGNEESICDQHLRPFYQGEVLTAIKVEYVGWCGSMGPYTYYCE